MASSEEILTAARQLGEKIAGHEAAKRLKQAMAKLRADVEAQRALTDFNRQAAKIAEKESKRQPIEVEDKHELDRLQKAVVRNPLLRDLQVAQMDYLDLMRRVDEAIAEKAGTDVEMGLEGPAVGEKK